MEEQTLQQAVETQAQARVRGDLATFASYVTPQALIALHRIAPTRASRTMRGYEILDLTEHPDSGVSVVRYRADGSHVVRSIWARNDGHWKVIDATVPPDSVQVPRWKRVLATLGLASMPPAPAERRDLQ